MSGYVKLSDFGIAKVTAGHSASQSEIRGTAGYISPEILEGAPATQRADVFAMPAARDLTPTAEGGAV